PSSTRTSTVVAPASSALSTSSRTTAAGPVTTSPAAISVANRSSICRIRPIGRTSERGRFRLIFGNTREGVPGFARALGPQRSGSALIYTHVVDLVAARELGAGGVAAVGASNGEVEDEVERLVEGIPAVVIYGLGEVGAVEKPIVHGQLDRLGCPVHPPDVE